MSDLRTAAQQALEAMRRAVPTGKITLYEWDKALSDLRAALAQEQAEPICKCDLRTRLVGDGCEACNPELAAESAQEQAEPDAYGYASYLAVAIWEKHYKDTAPHWKPLDDLVGVLTQIDNMTAGLTRQEQAEPVQEPVAWIQPDHLQKARVAPFLCRVEPTQRCPDFVALYTAPPKLVPLTEEEIEACRQQGYDHDGLHSPFDFREAARAVERALEKKNGR